MTEGPVPTSVGGTTTSRSQIGREKGRGGPEHHRNNAHEARANQKKIKENDKDNNIEDATKRERGG